MAKDISWEVDWDLASSYLASLGGRGLEWVCTAKGKGTVMCWEHNFAPGLGRLPRHHVRSRDLNANHPAHFCVIGIRGLVPGARAKAREAGGALYK